MAPPVKQVNNSRSDEMENTYIIVVDQSGGGKDKGLASVERAKRNKWTRILSHAENGAICRLCLEESDKDQMVPMVGDGSKLRFLDVTIQTAVESFSGINVTSEDQLPSNICALCLSKVESMWAFRQLCLNSHNIIHQLKWATEEFCKLSKKACQPTDRTDDEATDTETEEDGVAVKREGGRDCNVGESESEDATQSGSRKVDANGGKRGRPAKRRRTQKRKSTTAGRHPARRLTVEDGAKRTWEGRGGATSHTPYNCTICSRRYKTEARLSQHMRSAHARWVKQSCARTIVCTICNTKLSRSAVSDHYLAHKATTLQ